MKDIKNYEGLYAVTSCGKVWSYRSKRFLKPAVTVDGYLRVCLTKDDEKKCFSIHRLVAEAYLDNPNNYDTVDHIDFDKTNNCVNNLQWMSRSENSGKKRGYKGRSVRCIELNTIYPSASEAARYLNLYRSNIAMVCQGKRKTAGGYHWEYVEASELEVKEDIK